MILKLKDISVVFRLSRLEVTAFAIWIGSFSWRSGKLLKQIAVRSDSERAVSGGYKSSTSGPTSTLKLQTTLLTLYQSLSPKNSQNHGRSQANGPLTEGCPVDAQGTLITIVTALSWLLLWRESALDFLHPCDSLREFSSLMVSSCRLGWRSHRRNRG